MKEEIGEGAVLSLRDAPLWPVSEPFGGTVARLPESRLELLGSSLEEGALIDG